jgi:hypothetical protein
MSFTSDLRKHAEKIFSERQGKENFVKYEFKDYKGQLDWCNFFCTTCMMAKLQELPMASPVGRT